MGCPDIWPHIILGVSVRLFLWLTFESVNWAKQIALPYGVGLSQSGEGLKRTQSTHPPGRKGELLWPDHLELGHWLFPAFGSEPKLWLFLAVQAYWPVDWNYTTGSPGSLASSLQLLGLLSFHNHVIQLLIISLFLDIYSYIPLDMFLWRTRTFLQLFILKAFSVLESRDSNAIVINWLW